jgi:hypothetical protein
MVLFALGSDSSLAAGSGDEIGSCRASVPRSADPLGEPGAAAEQCGEGSKSEKGSLHGDDCALVWLMDRYRVPRRHGRELAFFLYAPTTFRNRSSQARAGRNTVKTGSPVADVILI